MQPRQLAKAPQPALPRPLPCNLPPLNSCSLLPLSPPLAHTDGRPLFSSVKHSPRNLPKQRSQPARTATSPAPALRKKTSHSPLPQPLPTRSPPSVPRASIHTNTRQLAHRTSPFAVFLRWRTGNLSSFPIFPPVHPHAIPLTPRSHLPPARADMTYLRARACRRFSDVDDVSSGTCLPTLL